MIMDQEPVTVKTNDNRCLINFISILDCLSSSIEQDESCRGHAELDNPYPIMIESPNDPSNAQLSISWD